MGSHKAQPIDLQLYEGNKNKRTKAEIEARRKAEASFKVASDNIKPPTWLDSLGKREFKKIVKEMEELDLLTNLDVHFLSLYCDAYSNYVAVAKELKETGMFLDDDGVTVPNKEMIIRKKQFYEQMKSLGSEFGFSPSSRAKMALNQAKAEEEEADEFNDI